MFAFRAPGALNFRRIDRSQADKILSLDFGGREALDFLDPVESILQAVQAGLSHLLFGMEDASGLVGFFVVHPDRRDASCWWLGWFAVAHGHQGRGYGRAALEHVIRHFRRVDGCRRIRLYVAEANRTACRLYDSVGFSERGTDAAGWRTLEYEMPPRVPAAAVPVGGFAVHAAPAKRHRRRMRLRSSVGPFAARSIGSVRGPPCRQLASIIGNTGMLDAMRMLMALRAERRGVTALEYAIMAGLISAVLVTAVATLTTGFPRVFARIAGYLT